MFPIPTLAGSVVLLAVPTAGLDIDRANCTVERITAAGERIAGQAAGAQTGAGSASARASSRGAGGAGASASASSSSSTSGDGRTSARSVATSVDPKGRTVTTIHENGRCTITIDERAASGGTR